MREEFGECDPNGIVAMLVAAVDLEGKGNVDLVDDKVTGHLFKIACWRCAAVGYREIAIMFSGDYDGKRPVDANHDRTLILKYAREADRKADNLCHIIGLSFECEGADQSKAALFWTAFKNIHATLMDENICWRLITSDGIDLDKFGVPIALGDDNELIHYAKMANDALFDLHRDQTARILARRLN